MAVSTASQPSDPDLEAVAWDLEPLVDGEGSDGVKRRLSVALARAHSVRRALRGQARRSRRRGPGGGDERACGDPRASRARAATTRRCASPPTPPSPPTGRCCSTCRSRRRRSRRRCCSSSWSGRRCPRSAREELLADDALDFCRHHLRNVRRYREHLLSEPEEKILAEKSLTGAGAWTRLFEELTSAIEVPLPGAGETPDGGGEATETVALDVALSRLALADRDLRRTAAEAVTAALAPGLRTRAYPVQHAARRQGHRRPPAPLPALAGRAQPRQRGQRRVCGGADRGRAWAL